MDYKQLKNNQKIFFNKIKSLTSHHKKNCKEYKNFLNNFFTSKFEEIIDLPYIPTSVFKSFELKSIKNKDITKRMISSGTSGENSKIFLNNENAILQTRVLSQLFKENVFKDRIPMMILDRNPSLSRSAKITARVAAINGFSIYGKNHTYLIKENNEIDFDTFFEFINKFKNEIFLIFGFTSSVYEFFLKLQKIKKITLTNGILLHGGGWKKLEKKKISNKKFKKDLKKIFKIKNIINYYGLIEQAGSIFFECKEGYFHTSVYSDIYIRDEKLKLANFKNRGLVQLISVLPTSYPGHNILTEDMGAVYGVDDCKCGRLGKYFKIFGRAQGSELRGCSNI
jgi:phenylacetate-coenzyme A ligase PaaK-like adenylate-forming protein